jgi:3-oxoacyl-[acyl-carrier-protein] synthase II
VTVRLWVTGLGLVTPLGHGVEATWGRLVRGDRAIAPVTIFDAAAQRVAMAAEVAGVTLPAAPRGAWSRTSAMALSAAAEALEAARLAVGDRRVGLVVGGSTGGMFETEEWLARFHAEPGRREAVVEMLAHPLTSTGDLLCDRLGPFARARTLSSACSSGANALVVAASWLLSGEVDAVVAGGADGLCRLTLTGFNALGAIDPETCRPFDRRRRGTTLGEGAGFLVLERDADARRRGANPIAELAGWAIGSEAHHITNPAADGAVVGRLVGRAIARARLTPADVDYVNAHGTGTPANDAMEAAALTNGLGDEIHRVPVSSSKGQIGHTLAAAGAIEAAITALVVARRTLVPTGGLEEADPALPLVHVPGRGRAVARVRAALSNAFGFGGMATVLAFTEPELGPPPGASAAPPRVAVVTGVSAWTLAGRLGAAECAALPEAPTAAAASASVIDVDAFLDPARARRLDRMARLGTVVVEHALAQTGAPPGESGILFGNAFGNVDPCAAFMHRVFEKGPRVASPAEFPNLVPSSPVGHMSIYTGAHGPAFATSDLSVSGASAFAQAAQLVLAGDAACIVAGASEPKSPIVDRILWPLFADTPVPDGAVRADLAAALVVEDASAALRRGARVLARVAQIVEWHGAFEAHADAIVAPRSNRAEVVLSETRESASIDAFLARTAWSDAPRVTGAPALGESDALAAAALAIAVARIADRRIDEALVVAMARGRGFAFVLVTP